MLYLFSCQVIWHIIATSHGRTAAEDFANQIILFNLDIGFSKQGEASSKLIE